MRYLKMRKIIVIMSLLVAFLLLAACAPKPLTDEEVKAELTKLTPEQRQQLLKDLESDESGAFVGQAVAYKYGSPKLAYADKQQIRKVLTEGGIIIDW